MPYKELEYANEADNKVDDEKIAKKKQKTFKEYYQDPEFKEKHKKYVSEKIKCSCGRMVMRMAMAKHKRTKIHERNLKEKNSDQSDIDNIIEKLVENKLQKILNKSD